MTWTDKNPERNAQIVALSRAGLKRSAISAALGISRDIVGAVVARARATNKLPPIEDAAAEARRSSAQDLDAKFCAAMNKAIAEGKENPHVGVIVADFSIETKPLHFYPSANFSSCGSSAALCAEIA